MSLSRLRTQSQLGLWEPEPLGCGDHSARYNNSRLKPDARRRSHGSVAGRPAFGDPLSLMIPDPDHSDDEGRHILLGLTLASRLVVVVHTDREDAIRIISARLATRSERRGYEDGQSS